MGKHGVTYITRPLCFVCGGPIDPQQGIYIHGNIYVVTDDPDSRPGILGSTKVEEEEHAFHSGCLDRFIGGAIIDGASASLSDGQPLWDEDDILDEPDPPPCEVCGEPSVYVVRGQIMSWDEVLRGIRWWPCGSPHFFCATHSRKPIMY